MTCKFLEMQDHSRAGLLALARSQRPYWSLSERPYWSSLAAPLLVVIGAPLRLAGLPHLLLENDNLPAHLKDVADTDCIDTLLRKRDDLLKEFYVLIRVEAILAGLARRFEQPCGFVTPQNLRGKPEQLRNHADTIFGHCRACIFSRLSLARIPGSPCHCCIPPYFYKIYHLTNFVK